MHDMSDRARRSVDLSRREVHRKPENTLLTDRAAKFLENGPADVVDLIGYICNLPAAPRIVAEHMAEAMFAGRTEFRRDDSGKWLFVSGTTASAPAFDARVEMPYVEYPRIGQPSEKRKRGSSKPTSSIPPQPLKSMSWVVVDVETTGGSPPSDRITEIAAVVVRDGRIAEVFESLVNPMRPIPSFVSKITNIEPKLDPLAFRSMDCPEFDCVNRMPGTSRAIRSIFIIVADVRSAEVESGNWTLTSR